MRGGEGRGGEGGEGGRGSRNDCFRVFVFIHQPSPVSFRVHC